MPEAAGSASVHSTSEAGCLAANKRSMHTVAALQLLKLHNSGGPDE